MSSTTALREKRIQEQAHALWVTAGSPAGGPKAFVDEARLQIAADETAVDETVEDSFPASDPPSNTGITGPEKA